MTVHVHTWVYINAFMYKQMQSVQKSGMEEDLNLVILVDFFMCVPF